MDCSRFRGWLWCAISKAGTPLDDERFRSLAEEQASLRRVATLVARRSPPDEVFAAATEEVAQLLGVQFAHLGRYEPDDTVTFVAVSGGNGVCRLVPGCHSGVKTSARLSPAPVFPLAWTAIRMPRGRSLIVARERGIRLSIGTPIVVEGRVWGVTVIGSGEGQDLGARC